MASSEFVANIPKDAGPIVGITMWADELIIACRNRVFVLKQGHLLKVEPLATREVTLEDIARENSY